MATMCDFLPPSGLPLRRDSSSRRISLSRLRNALRAAFTSSLLGAPLLDSSDMMPSIQLGLRILRKLRTSGLRREWRQQYAAQEQHTQQSGRGSRAEAGAGLQHSLDDQNGSGE